MTASNAEPLDDYEELIAALNARGVLYLVIGAYAVGFHGHIRATSDMDLAVDPAPENADRLAAALKDFAGVSVNPDDIKEKTLIELGRDPQGVDIITTMKGLTWDRAWSERESGLIGRQPAPFLSRACLIANKRATGRERDLLDLKALGAG